MKPFKQEKVFYSIKEVSDHFGVNQSLLRYWEKEFDSICPSKTAKGTRQYSQADIEAIRLVHYLVKEKGLTLDGAKKKLKENKETVVQTEKIVSYLQHIREDLMGLKMEFDEMEKEYKA
ncbi:MAG: MerR family transcriptional regulator [Dysgonamonadaceae bacterium]|jgi:DNA-binding transcriptional MerR regulator|nr:MerR family transcriptional regulator [Dysgonamonadaceae bacterium]